MGCPGCWTAPAGPVLGCPGLPFAAGQRYAAG